MRFSPFALERWFDAYEFRVPHLLCASDCESLNLGELLALEADASARFEALSLGYTESAGMPLLKEAIAALYTGGNPDDVLVHVGAQEAILTLSWALVEPGDEVIAVVPCYASQLEVPRVAGASVVPWRLEAETGWRHDPEVLRGLLSPRTRLVILTSPHNPTGAVIDGATLRAIADLAEQMGFYVLVDEVYRFLEFSSSDRPPAGYEVSPHFLSLGVMSKSFGLAGLRIGWLAGRDRQLLEKVAQVKDYTSICAPGPSSFLAELALRHKDAILERTRKIVTDNLELVRSFFRTHESIFDWVPPVGGPVILPWFRDERDARPWCRELAENAGVLLAPGDTFGAESHFLRFGLGRIGFPAALQQLESYLHGYEV